jgi:hypothetical protein
MCLNNIYYQLKFQIDSLKTRREKNYLPKNIFFKVIDDRISGLENLGNLQGNTGKCPPQI